MDNLVALLSVRAATIDELLSAEFESLPGQKTDSDVAASRLAAWCRSCASGDWGLFERRLNRDRISIAAALARFATVRRRDSSSVPAWVKDAEWIVINLQEPDKDFNANQIFQNAHCAFQELLMPAVTHAHELLWSGLRLTTARLAEPSQACLGVLLLKELSSLCAPALYERFSEMRKAKAVQETQHNSTALYDQFVIDMKNSGWRELFSQKPVLLRLMAVLLRQWIITSREFLTRLDIDWQTIRHDLLCSQVETRVVTIEGNFSDPHNHGRSVLIVTFEDNLRVVYKPKDLRLEFAWNNTLKELNRVSPPIDLKTVHVIARDGYGWTEFIDHVECDHRDQFKRFFRRAGAWLALFHCFATSDMHQENIIACGEHPVPIDLEMSLQAASDESKSDEPEAHALEAAVEIVANSVMTVGLIPAYGRSPKNDVFAIGGMNSNWGFRQPSFGWKNINTDSMRPEKADNKDVTIPNLPHTGAQYAKFGDHIEDFVSGFEDYLKFLIARRDNLISMLDGFAGLPIRRVIRPTRFYAMVGQRLRNHRIMHDGMIWSAQADFLARLADWQNDSDSLWPLQHLERSALLELNVPHFVSPSNANEIRDASGNTIRTHSTTGLDRARSRIRDMDDEEVAWQVEIIRQNTRSLFRSDGRPAGEIPPKSLLYGESAFPPNNQIFHNEVDRIVADISHNAIRRGTSAAWIGIDWVGGDSDVFQLVPLGLDLYNGVAGIAVFLAAQSAAAKNEASGELALQAISHLRKNIKSRNAARIARALGLGAATGLGSIVYALAVTSKSLGRSDLLDDAVHATSLFTEDLIAADKQLDVMAGSAGGILALLRVYRDTQSGEVLKRAIRCGEHLLAQRRLGPEGRRSWLGEGLGTRQLTGMSHGAAGFAYALTALARVTGRDDFLLAGTECIAFESSSYHSEKGNWPDLRFGAEQSWPCRWCHGAPGIGLARVGMIKFGWVESPPNTDFDPKLLLVDIQHAVDCVQAHWPGQDDTLCCGTLGGIECLWEAANVFDQDELRDLAARRLMAITKTAASRGDYRWYLAKGKFNLGLFRGLAGVGYTLLRQTDSTIPNVLLWE